ncbi:MAG: chromosomal replication initiator protein DnaA [Clostridia bacterium]|nr:chromosomal replication initiator protein DnaA [Clostridia bacterium]MBR3884838.1 chromosomal replication initiator protein DnaA [Clostridia bacterium]
MENEDFISTSNVNPIEIWPDILEEIAKNTTSISFDVWIKTLEIEDIKENILVLNVPTKSQKTVLQKNYKNLIIKSANAVYSAISGVEFVVKTDDEETVEESKPQTKGPIYVGPEDSGSFDDGPAFSFNPKYTFDSFIVGGSNQFAAAAAKAVADEPSTNINPLFIYGGSGLGKTHLLHAIGNHLQEHKPKLNVVYVTTDKFVTEFTSSLQKHTTEKFRETYSKADVFIIDDIQSIIKKTQTQEQFFNIFNDLYQKGKQIIITCDKQPKELNPLEERLRSRLEWGMLADIGVPDVETRIAILNKKAQMERYNVSKEVIEYIADVATTNVREMEGFLSRTVFFSRIQKEDVVTIESAREALKNIAKQDEETIDATKIVEIVCKFYGVKKEELLARKRTKNIAEARQIAMYLITEYLNIPLESVGNIFGKDHSTVIYAKNKVAEDIKKYKKLEVQINDLKQMIEGK